MSGLELYVSYCSEAVDREQDLITGVALDKSMGISHSCSSSVATTDAELLTDVDEANTSALLEAGKVAVRSSAGSTHGRSGLGFSMANLSAGSHRNVGLLGSSQASRAALVNAGEWLAEVVYASVHVDRVAVSRYIVSHTMGEEAALTLRSSLDLSIRTSEEYRHFFFSGGLGASGAMAERGLGLFHSFSVLELSDGRSQLCVEKFNDALELMIGTGADFSSYLRLFRASGDERPTKDRPIVAQGKRQIENNITVGELIEWIDGPLAMIWQPYSLLGKNCQTFAGDLRGFLISGKSATDALEELRSDRVIVLEAVRRDGTLLQHVANKLKHDHAILRAAVASDARAIVFSQANNLCPCVRSI
jgi:hypothetical protein